LNHKPEKRKGAAIRATVSTPALIAAGHFRAASFADYGLFLHRDQPAGDHAQQSTDDNDQHPGGEDALKRGSERLRLLVHGPHNTMRQIPRVFLFAP
jgi:hypothetical protein